MDIYVLNSSFAAVGIVSEYRSVIWTPQLYGLGEFQLIVAGTSENIAMIREGSMLVRDKDMAGSALKNVMLIEKTVISFDADAGYILTATGRSIKCLLNRRVIWDQVSVEEEPVASVILTVLDENVINPSDSDREMPGITVETPTFATNNVTLQARGEPVGDWIASLCEEQALGWDVVVESGQMVIKLIQGTDRTTSQSENPPVVFSAEFDNLISATYTRDTTTYHNAALIGGEGEGTDQIVVGIGGASGMDRYETYVDGSDVSSNGEIITLATYLDMLRQRGEEELAAAGVTEKTEGKIDTTGLYKIGTDFTLGDYVTLIDKRIGLSKDTRLIEIIESEDENGHTVLGNFSGMEE